jgi:alkylation response protein AidB-like acyl-CoA dehydrogenase
MATSFEPDRTRASAGAEERALLAASVAAFVARENGVRRARALRGAPREHDREVWLRMAGLGWLGILVPERYGGLGLGLAEMATVARGLARGLAPEPLVPAAVLATGALLAGENDSLKRVELPRLVSGEKIAALAWQERAGALAPGPLATRATAASGALRLSGTKRFVAGAAQADAFLVTAASDFGPVLCWVPRAAAGVRLALEPLADGRFHGTLALEDVEVAPQEVAARGERALAAVSRALDDAAVVAGAELCGVMERALEMTLDHLRTRVQFGRPIGAFQALAHRAVDLYIQCELSSAVLEEALAALAGEPEERERAALASRVKARCSEAALRVAREAIQLHGAIGFTDEHDIGLYLKRALVLAGWLGSAAAHRRRYAALARDRDGA